MTLSSLVIACSPEYTSENIFISADASSYDIPSKLSTPKVSTLPKKVCDSNYSPSPIASSPKCNQDLSTYPSFLVKDGMFKGYMVVGEKAPAIDSLSATDIISSMKYQGKEVDVNNSFKLDTEITDIKAQNLIIVGNSCNNYLSAEVESTISDSLCCDVGYPPIFRSKIKLVNHNIGNGTCVSSLLVSGDTGADTRLAAKVLAHRYNELSGTEVEISGDNYVDAKIKIVK